MKKKKMLLFGGSGLLGTRIRELLSGEYAIVSPTHLEVNLLKKNDVERSIPLNEPNIIVYAAGQTNQDKAEKEQELTVKLNKDAVAWICKIAKKNTVPVVYFSTDAVFAGNQSKRPYKETDQKNPINFYGKTKSLGEDIVLESSNNNLVLRLISIYTSHFLRKTDFLRNILVKLSQKTSCYAIVDQYTNPTFTDDAVYGLLKAIGKKTTGILHLGSIDYITNYDFIKLAAQKFNYDKELVLPISFNEFFDNKTAKRAQYAWLDTSRAQAVLGTNVLHASAYNLEKMHKQQERQ